MITSEVTIDCEYSFECLNQEQRVQILRQIQYHIEGPPFETIQLDGLTTLNLSILPGVTRPMSSKGLAKWLWKNPTLYENKRVLDVGTGCGIQGIVCLLGGAESALFTDITDSSINCTEVNLSKSNRTKRGAIVKKSDLFDSMENDGCFDLIIFAQPYFSGTPVNDFEFTRGMFNTEYLQHRFFEDARNYLNPKANLLLMGWNFAGESNHPALIAPNFGFKVAKIESYFDWTGIQQGEFQVVLLEQ